MDENRTPVTLPPLTTIEEGREQKFSVLMRHISPLVVTDDLASDAGVHANLASRRGTWQNVQQETKQFYYQCDSEESIFQAVHATGIGDDVYRAFCTILSPLIQDSTSHRQMRSL